MLRSMKAKVIFVILLLFAAVIAGSVLKTTFQYAVRIDSDGTNIIFSPAPFVELIDYEEKNLISDSEVLPLRHIANTAYEFNVISGGMQTLTIHYRNFWGQEKKEIFEISVNNSDCMTFVDRMDPTGTYRIDLHVFTPNFTE